MAEDSLELKKYINMLIQEAQEISSNLKKKNYTPKHMSKMKIIGEKKRKDLKSSCKENPITGREMTS